MKVWLDELLKAFDESQHPREPAGSSKGGQFRAKQGGSTGRTRPTKLREPSPEEDADRRAVDHGLKMGRRARAVLDRYGLDADELIDLWAGGIDVEYGMYGPTWDRERGNIAQTPGPVIHRALNAALGKFADAPWTNHTWEAAFWEGVRGKDRLRFVRGWRFGRVPARGYSHNYRDDTPEAGVSLMEVTAVADDGPLPSGPSDRVSKMFIEASNKPRVWVEGWLISARGSDGEPLVVGAREVEGPA